MQKTTARQSRREERQAKRKRRQMIVAAIVLLVIAAAAVYVYFAFNRPQAASPEGGPPEIPANVETITTASGLQYQDIVVGTGDEAAPTNQVQVHYTGWLEDGTKFDSSVDRNQPFEFTLTTGNVIQGWHEGVEGMKVGGKRRLIIPPDLGYGAQGYPPVIPANATLIFDVELLEVQ
jgi:FKBP-type peptidyl-prolyl cis-trans isomerase